MPVPTGVPKGPFMAKSAVRRAFMVSSGRGEPVSAVAFSPASSSTHSMRMSDSLASAASMTGRAARQISGPMPSPSIQ